MAVDLVDKMFSALIDQQTTRDNVSNTALSSGITLMQKGKYKEAAASFKQATALNPANVDAYNYLAVADLKLGKRKEAIEAYTISLKLDRNQDQAHVDLANIYIEDKRYSDAERELKSAMAANPQNSTASYTLGHLYVQMDRPVDAEKLFRKTLRLEPKNGNVNYAIGLALNKQGRYDEAISQLTEALGKKKDFVPALFELGNSYIALDQKDKVQEQIDALRGITTQDAQDYADELTAKIRQPKISSYNSGGSSLNLNLNTINILAFDPSLITPGATKDLSVQFQFDSEMDVGSVMDVMNWRISKASDQTAGIYNNGLYSPSSVPVPFIPKQVSYDQNTQQATVVFTITQTTSDVSGTLDPAHLVFKFMGKDVNGKKMDPTADEFDGFANTPF